MAKRSSAPIEMTKPKQSVVTKDTGKFRPDGRWIWSRRRTSNPTAHRGRKDSRIFAFFRNFMSKVSFRVASRRKIVYLIPLRVWTVRYCLHEDFGKKSRWFRLRQAVGFDRMFMMYSFVRWPDADRPHWFHCNWTTPPGPRPVRWSTTSPRSSRSAFTMWPDLTVERWRISLLESARTRRIPARVGSRKRRVPLGRRWQGR